MNSEQDAEIRRLIPYTTSCHYVETNQCPIQGNLACQNCYSNAARILDVIEQAGYRKVPELTVLSDMEIVRITDLLCEEFGIEWGDWSGLTQRKIEDFIIDVYTNLLNAQLEAIKKQIEEANRVTWSFHKGR